MTGYAILSRSPPSCVSKFSGSAREASGMSLREARPGVFLYISTTEKKWRRRELVRLMRQLLEPRKSVEGQVDTEPTENESFKNLINASLALPSSVGRRRQHR